MDARFRFSSRTADIDRELVHRWLSTESYWATGRPRATQETAIDGSRNYGVFDAETGAQVAYARVVTDGATFAWLCDVFVDPAERGKGLGVGLIDGVVADLEPFGLKRILLATGDAHGLYARFGFGPLDDPSKLMARAGA
ncbi:GNAT family N-acetyltransferase [Humibacter albus]|uniref:GNAT family N-acetyltransferase n=1 Tax=Humibacter albus TaxID=427754 RepID=UPI0003B543A5|nr:GNAT family N-acetyltransferase [Humibacter albus]